MPPQCCRAGSFCRSTRNNDPSTRHLVVHPAILVLITQATAHLQPELWSHGDVARVVEPVQVRAEYQAVLDVVRGRAEVRLDVSCIKHRHRMLARDRAPSAIGLEQAEPEGTLA